MPPKTFQKVNYFFGRFWEAKWNNVGIQNRQKIDPKRHQKHDAENKGALGRLGGVYRPPETPKDLPRTTDIYPPPRFARRRVWGLKSKQPVACGSGKQPVASGLWPVAVAVAVVYGLILGFNH